MVQGRTSAPREVVDQRGGVAAAVTCGSPQSPRFANQLAIGARKYRDVATTTQLVRSKRNQYQREFRRGVRAGSLTRACTQANRNCGKKDAFQRAAPALAVGRSIFIATASCV